MRFKQILKVVLPPVLFSSLQTILGFIRFAIVLVKEWHTLKKNRMLKDLFHGRRAFVIATGPSIRDLPLSKLKNELVITLSNAFLHKELSNINPAFHIFAPYHEPLILEDYIKWLELGHRTLPKKTKIFLNIKSKEMVNKYHLFHGRDVFYAYFTNVPLIISDNLMMPLLGPQTVPHMSLPLLAFMGVKEILLLGCDHNVLKDYKKNINHFFPVGHDPRSNASDFAAWPGIIESHQNSCNVFLIYLKYIKMLKGKNVKLINLSDDSWLDFIPLLSYFDII